MLITLPTDANVSTLTQAGLAVESLPNLVQFLILCMQTIYGVDINVDSNSPDGQLINIFAQCTTDQLEVILDAYNAMAISTSYGVRLDQLVALNGLARKQGTYTQAKVVVTIAQALTLPGLDQTAIPAFEVADNAGNQFQLITSYIAGGSGTPTLTFRAVNIGQVQTSANTITNISTPTLGISAVNNPSIASDIIGVNEETDAQLKVRQAQSFNLAAIGPSDSMESALRNVPGIVDALVIENNTAGTINTVPPYSVWPIVNGGTPTTIAAAIYAKKSPGTPMKGSLSQNVARPNGQTFTANWDTAVSQPLYIKFSIIWRGGVQAFANADIIAALAIALVYKLGQNPSIADIYTAMATIAPTAIVTINSANQGVSVDNSTWGNIVSPNTSQYYFVVLVANISII
jgi:uncharacterized phage protein gp47/JayE